MGSGRKRTKKGLKLLNSCKMAKNVCPLGKNAKLRRGSNKVQMRVLFKESLCYAPSIIWDMRVSDIMIRNVLHFSVSFFQIFSFFFLVCLVPVVSQCAPRSLEH